MARRAVGRGESTPAKGETKGSGTGSSVSDTRPGWSFYETADTCWRLLFHRYVEPVLPPFAPPHLLLGSAYHARHEGRGMNDLKKDVKLAPHAAEAERLFVARTTKGPPLPKALAREVTVACEGALEGVFFSTPDVVEERGIRDFKTAARLYGDEAEKWAVSGEIIGELVATGAQVAVVDVITKEKVPDFGLFEVRLTPAKRAAFTELILDLLQQMRARYAAHQAKLKVGEVGMSPWPQSFSSCFRYGQPCQFYALCWGDGFGFKKGPPIPWVKTLLGGGKVRLPGVGK